ncbi:PREDICTED: uncharacterized protein LOC109147760 [Ipomoea nil]|uniref:uncharacterized protein LOC109147760 n=1 Tax=Ipomoea nil TaxID=35883 RepID=UPI000900C04A|nr:PREDICTED: uncharacterized protein LOC109147760 [Ipomoea nil]
MVVSALANMANIVHINVPTHFPIWLTDTNYPVWQRQVETTLIGFDLLGYINGDTKEPAKFSNAEGTTPNPTHAVWFRQDQIIIGALLGSYSESLQSLTSSTTTVTEAWTRLTSTYANDSMGRVIYLKTRLLSNPRGSRSITEYLQDMRSIADSLATAHNPVSDSDLISYVLNRLGNEYATLIPAIRVQGGCINFGDLYSILTDHERMIKSIEEARQSHLVTANVTQLQSGTPPSNHQRDQSRGTGQRRSRPSNRQNVNDHRQTYICKFCNFQGLETRFCRKLARFLRDNNVPFGLHQSPNNFAGPSVNTSVISQPQQQ